MAEETGADQQEEVLTEPYQRVIDEFNARWAPKDQEGEELRDITSPLFHYTDSRGLDGILRNQELWLTSHRHLNDPSEFIYGNRLVQDAFRQLSIKQHPLVKYMCSVMQRMNANAFNSSFEFFIGSLSLEQDDLGQWRAYGDDGKGFAIGLAPILFDRNREQPTNVHRATIVSRVEYDPVESRRRQFEAAEYAVQLLKRCISDGVIKPEEQSQGELFLSRLSSALTVRTTMNSITCKHHAYKHEQEVRLISVREASTISKVVETRTRQSTIVPFIRYKLPIQSKGSVTRIVVGPGAQRNTEADVRRMLQSVGIDPTNLVARSDIPYRGH